MAVCHCKLTKLPHKVRLPQVTEAEHTHVLAGQRASCKMSKMIPLQGRHACSIEVVSEVFSVCHGRQHCPEHNTAQNACCRMGLDWRIPHMQQSQREFFWHYLVASRQISPHYKSTCLMKISLRRLWPKGLYLRLKRSKRWKDSLPACMSSRSTFKSYLHAE